MRTSQGRQARTQAQRQILGAMLADSAAWHYGLGIAGAAGLAAGTIYSVLAQMERAGWLESRWDSSGADSEAPRRRVYRLTGSGQRVAVAEGETPAAARNRGRFGFGWRRPRTALA